MWLRDNLGDVWSFDFVEKSYTLSRKGLWEMSLSVWHGPVWDGPHMSKVPIFTAWWPIEDGWQLGGINVNS